jgi:hypothetical protein
MVYVHGCVYMVPMVCMSTHPACIHGVYAMHIGEVVISRYLLLCMYTCVCVYMCVCQMVTATAMVSVGRAKMKTVLKMRLMFMMFLMG